MDREKVIKGLECCLRESEHIDDNPCADCPYYDIDSGLGGKCIDDKDSDALELLKEQDRQNWRLCSEELPETTDEVLITYTVVGNKKKRFVETASYCDDVEGEGHWTSVWDEYCIAGAEEEVIAWMPLPKPYREGRRSANESYRANC